VSTGPEPLPSCLNLDVNSLPDVHSLTQEQARVRLGPPTIKESFRMEERQDEFHIELENTYPLTDPRNRTVPIDEWTWFSGDCRFTIWFHQTNGVWHALDNAIWHKNTAF
jgi:hypothetical protein